MHAQKSNGTGEREAMFLVKKTVLHYIIAIFTAWLT